ncbi:MAG: hypothetical protein JWM63_512 [Gammaproteobacteria bacterium]|jgi:hypothetical protein|nr:hypothetical protein [Gammaproteobacteria bacterium]
MSNTYEFTAQTLAFARHAIESGRDVAVVPEEYMNFELALAIVDGCRNAICMADAHDPNTLIQKLEIASESLAIFQSGATESSVTTARTHIDETIEVLRPFVAPDC